MALAVPLQWVPKLMALGAYPDLSLKLVRELHKPLRTNLSAGVDPMETRKSEKGAFTQATKAPVQVTTVTVIEDDKGKKVVRTTPVVNSFGWVEGQWFKQWQADKDPRHAKQVENRITIDILPKLGHRPISEIEAPEIAQVALAIEARGAVDLAHRSLHTMSQIFRYGIVWGFCKRNPAMDIKGSDFLKGLTRGTSPVSSRASYRSSSGILSTTTVCPLPALRSS